MEDVGGSFSGNALGEHEVCANDHVGSRFARTVNKYTTAVPDGGVEEIADATKHDHQRVHVVVRYIKIAACHKRL